MTETETWEAGVYHALATAAGEMKAIPKDQRNTQQNFDYRSIEAIVGHAKPLLRDEGLAIIPTGFELIQTEQVQSSGGSRGWRTIVRGHWLITHSDGSSVEASMLGEAVDYGDKSASKAVQMAYKYLLTQLLGIGSEDPDGYSPEMVVEEPPVDLSGLIKVKVAIFKEWDDDERAESFKFHSKGLLGGRPVNSAEVDQVVKAMAEDYYEQYPLSEDEAPF